MKHRTHKPTAKAVAAILCAALMLTACGSKETANTETTSVTATEATSVESTEMTTTEAAVAEPAESLLRLPQNQKLLLPRLLLQNLLHLPWNPQQHP